MSCEKILTISVAAYDVEDSIAYCLDSLCCCKQIDKLDIIVVNDGSSDATESIAEIYCRNFPKSIRLISKENGGHGSTINTSIQNIRGKYFKILDADDWVDSNSLDMLLEHLTYADTDLVCNPYYVVNTFNYRMRHILRSYPFHKRKKNRQIGLEKLPRTFIPDMHAMTFHSSVIKKMGPVVDENCYYVDQEYAILPLQYVHSVTLLDYPLYCYQIGSPTQSVQIYVKRERNKELLKVVKRLTKYYESVRNEVDDACSCVIQKGASTLITKQYRLYIGLGTREATNMRHVFDIWLSEQSPKLYDMLPKHLKYIKQMEENECQFALAVYLFIYRSIINIFWALYHLQIMMGRIWKHKGNISSK